jgi:hypothetical protein
MNVALIWRKEEPVWMLDQSTYCALLLRVQR